MNFTVLRVVFASLICYTISTFTTNAAPFIFSDNEASKYIQEFKSIAITQMHETGIPASIKLAQGMFESNFGKSRLAREGNNHFGIKCQKSWKGDKIFHDDDELNECFRKYPKVLDSYYDHSRILTTRSRYSKLFKLKLTDYKGWAKGLKKAGYATDPKYPEKVIYIVQRYKLHRFDKIEKPVSPTPIIVQKPKKAPSQPTTSNDELVAVVPPSVKANKAKARAKYSSKPPVVAKPAPANIEKIILPRQRQAIPVTPPPIAQQPHDQIAATPIIKVPAETVPIIVPERKKTAPIAQPKIAFNAKEPGRKQTQQSLERADDIIAKSMGVNKKHIEKKRTKLKESNLFTNVTGKQTVTKNGQYIKTKTSDGRVFFKPNQSTKPIKQTPKRKVSKGGNGFVNTDPAPQNKDKSTLKPEDFITPDWRSGVAKPTFKQRQQPANGQPPLMDNMSNNGAASRESEQHESFEQKSLENNYTQAKKDEEDALLKVDITKINKVKAVVYDVDVSVKRAAQSLNKSIGDLLKHNDLHKRTATIPAGTPIYLSNKNNKGTGQKTHLVRTGQSMWIISQLHGIKLGKLLSRNKMKVGQEPMEGEKIFLKGKTSYPPKIKHPKRKRNTQKYEYHRDRGNPIDANWASASPNRMAPKKSVVKSMLKKADATPSPMGAASASIYKPQHAFINEEAVNARHFRPAKQMAKLDRHKQSTSNKMKTYHVVEAEESLFSIALKYEISIEMLAKRNDIHSGKVAEGQLLYIPK